MTCFLFPKMFDIHWTIAMCYFNSTFDSVFMLNKFNMQTLFNVSICHFMKRLWAAFTNIKMN